jgi:thiol-disulfide isomerase/thioredoxin
MKIIRLPDSASVVVGIHTYQLQGPVRLNSVKMSSFLQAMEPPVLLERDESSVTVAWEVPDDFRSGTTCFELHMQQEGEDWKSLSDRITGTSVRKKNLSADYDYRFRIRSKPSTTGEWSEFSGPSEPMRVLSPDVKICAPPVLHSRDTTSLTLRWSEVPGAEGYLLRYRKENCTKWEYISSTISGNTAKKKNLESGVAYFFAVRPVVPSESDYEFSLSSSALSVAVLHKYYRDLLPPTLLSSRSSSGKVNTADALAGKTVAIYFSAHWCGPCRQFTPMLAGVYNGAKAANKDFEVVFCSVDHDEDEFNNYFHQNMPWLAVDYDDEKREEIAAKFRVSGIPNLVVLSPGGQVVESNAAKKPVTLALIDEWIRKGSAK